MILVVFLASTILVAALRREYLQRKVLDLPNWRSSHSQPKPRGGGASIVLVFTSSVLWLVHRDRVPENLGWALVGGGLAVAAVGFIDDHFRLSAKVRLLVHFLAACWTLWQLDGVSVFQIGPTTWNFGWIGQCVLLVGLVWMINLYNFMDGIDGLAGLEAVLVSALGGVVLSLSNLGGIAESALLLSATTAGFLVWNWPPARIFMGDVGSGFLGFVFGVLIISSMKERPSLLWPWLILLAVFIVDSTFTLVRRLFARTRWYSAHCSHAYQHAAREWSSHARVTIAIAMINLIWLFPLGLGAMFWPLAAPVLAIVAMAPLIHAAFHFDAGIPENRIGDEP